MEKMAVTVLGICLLLVFELGHPITLASDDRLSDEVMPYKEADGGMAETLE